jgi:TolB-like protein/Tfp pilus assembly protein PilF
VAEGDGSNQVNGSETPASEARPVPNPASATFISYASQDTAVAEALCAALEREGVACWIAPRDVRPGDFYADSIVQAINACSVLVLVLSQNAVDSAHVLREVERASAKKRPIIAFRIDSAPLPPGLEYFLSASQWIDSAGGSADRLFPKLIEAIRGRGVSAAKADPDSRRTEAAPRKPNPKGLIVAVAVAIALALIYLIADKFWPLHRGMAGQQEVATSSPATMPTATVVNDNSIAVLPFTDMSEKKDQEYFADGLSEELIDLLSKISALHVPARTSSFYFKGKSEDIPTIAKKLLVAYVLEGSVRKSGNHLRVTAQLVRADNGYHLWSETYDRQLDDVFKVQDEIATAVVSALKLKLLEAPTTKDHQTANPEAYDQYLIGRQLLLQENWVVDRSAAEAFRRAVALDPNYAPAWAELAEATFAAKNDATSVAEFNAMTQEAETAADKAIALRPDLADGYTVRGYIRSWGQWDFQGAGEDFRRALALEPENSDVLFKYVASVLMPTGRLDEALTATEKVMKVDPLNGSYWRRLGSLLYIRGDYRAAREPLQRSLEISPEQSNTAAVLAWTYLLEGQPALALSVSQRATAETFRQQGAALAEHDLGHAKEAQQRLDEMLAKHANDGAFQIAEVYAWRGEADRAFDWLERSYVQHDGGLTIVKIDPLLRKLRSDPRYTALLRKMRLLE